MADATESPGAGDDMAQDDRAQDDVARDDLPRDDDEARTEIAAAVVRAEEGDKRVLVVFGADWCGDSQAFHEAMNHPLVAPLLEMGFEVVELDVGDRDRHAALATGWGIDYAAGIPAVAVLDAQGERVTATTEGELAGARTMSPIEIATLLHRWMPEGTKVAT